MTRTAEPNYLNNRYHDPATGVFLSVDPLVATTGEPYLYASGNPTTLSDPSGLEPGCGATSYSGSSCGEAHAAAGLIAAGNEAAKRLQRVAGLDGVEDGAVNNWLATCLYAYDSCKSRPIDELLGGGSYDAEQLQIGAANLAVALAIVECYMAFGLVENSGGVISAINEGISFVPTFRIDGEPLGQFRIVDALKLADENPFPGCGLKCFFATAITGIAAFGSAGAACVLTLGFGCAVSIAGATAMTSVVYEASSNPDASRADLLCTAVFGSSAPVPGLLASAGSVGFTAGVVGVRAAGGEVIQESSLAGFGFVSGVCQ